MELQNDSTLLSKGPCPIDSCGSSDACSLYDDGHRYCFACESYIPPDDEAEKEEDLAVAAGFVGYLPTAIKSRKLPLATCKLYRYGAGKDSRGQPVQVACYYDPAGKEMVAQKTRTRDKQFRIYGNMKKAGLFGQHLFEPGPTLVITEGEIDAMSVSASFTNTRIPAVSINNGAAAAKKALVPHLEWVTQFQKVVLCFDQDEHGVEAAEEIAGLLPPGKCFIAHLPCKDASDTLTDPDQGAEAIRNAIWNAKEWRPDGILTTESIWDRAVQLHDEAGDYYSLPWPEMSEATSGMRRGEIVMLTGGTGTGKSALMKEMLVHFRKVHGLKLGYMGLEENTKQTVLDIIAVHRSERLRKLFVPDLSVYRPDFDELFGDDGIVVYDHFGSMSPENLLQRARYMIVAHELPFLFLDHISIAISGLQHGGDERQTIDYLVTQLRSLAEETQCGIACVSHLKRPQGKGHEEGAPTSLSQLRGSGSLGQISDTVIGAERNQQAEDGQELVTTLRLLKCRFTGETGVRGQLQFDPNTGRLNPLDDFGFESTEEDGGDF